MKTSKFSEEINDVESLRKEYIKSKHVNSYLQESKWEWASTVKENHKKNRFDFKILIFIEKIKQIMKIINFFIEKT